MAMPRWFAVPVLIVFTVPAFSDSPDRVAQEFLSRSYAGHFDQLPRASKAQTQEFEQQVRNLLRVRCVDNAAIAVSVVKSDTEVAGVDAHVVLTKSDTEDVRVSSTAELPLRIELARENGQWLVSRVLNRDDEFAERLLQVSVEERERLLCESPSRISKGLSRALHARALRLLNAAKYSQARDAVSLAKRIAIAVMDLGGEALALGLEVHLTEDRDRARALGRESVELAESAGDPDALARVWYDRGRSIRPSRWQPEDAVLTPETCYHNAIRIGERAEDPSIMVRALYSLANRAASGQSDYLTARMYIDRALIVARDGGDVTGEMALQGVLATVYFNQGDLERGRFHNARAMELAEKLGHSAYATLVVRAADTLVEERRYEEARAVFRRIVFRTDSGKLNIKGLVDASALGRALRAMATIEAESGNLAEAECLTRESAPYHGGPASAFLYVLAPHHARMGDHRTALSFSLASLAQPLRPHETVLALVAAGRAYRSLRMPDQGLAAALEAIELRETLDSRIAGDERQHAIASAVTSECYELAADLALDRDDPVQALAFLERGRARVLTNILENGRPDSMAEADAALQGRQLSLDREVARASSELQYAIRARHAPQTVKRLTKQLSEARANRDSFADGLQARSQRRAEIRRSIGGDEVLERVKRLPPHAVAVEYFVNDDRIHIFVVRDGGRVVVRTVTLDRRAIERKVDEFVQMLSDGDLRGTAAGRNIYDVLIAPIEKDLANARMAIIVPDECLWRVPFAALVDRRGRFLVERVAISYVPSITAYVTIAESHKVRTAPRTLSLFAVGNPTLNERSVRSAASLYRDAELGPLPDAEREVAAAGALYERPVVLTRAQATERKTKSSLPNAAIAHFATHAILDDVNPMYSRLLLAHDDDALSDGWLDSWEVAQMELNADLVVLSACDTARGRVGGGEGVLGLSWSFLVAGADAIVATQWKVASDSTANFMLAFHKSLRAAEGDPQFQKAQSLRDAQLRLIRDERTQHPFHWAPFILLGDPSSHRGHFMSDSRNARASSGSLPSN